MGSATIEGRVDMGEKVIINIKTFMDGHRPPDRVLSKHAVRRDPGGLPPPPLIDHEDISMKKNAIALAFLAGGPGLRRPATQRSPSPHSRTTAEG